MRIDTLLNMVLMLFFYFVIIGIAFVLYTKSFNGFFYQKFAVGYFQMDLGNGLEGTQDTLDAEIQSFFDSAPPLKNSVDVIEKLEEFIKRNSVASGKFTLSSINSIISVPSN